MPTVRQVVLSGGSGTRLWPLSTRTKPKQYAALLPSGSLLSATLRRLDGLEGLAPPLVVTGPAHVQAVEAELDQAGAGRGVVVVEPHPRNTAPAVVAAALVSGGGDDVLVVLPSDHLIEDEEGFGRLVSSATGLARRGRIVTFGIVPDRPETGFGYIQAGEPEEGGGRRVVSFKEKPSEAEAERLLAAGHHYWNSGMFVMQASTILAEAGRLAPEMLELVSASIRPLSQGRVLLGEEFGRAPSVSVDNAIMEHTELGVVLPAEVGWSDVGSYLSLWKASERDPEGNVVRGDVTLRDVRRSFVHSSTRPVAVAGLDDVVVVETEAGVLVVPLARSQEVKELSEHIGKGRDGP